MTPRPLPEGPSRVIPVRFSDSEYTMIRAAAEDACLPVSTFIRRHAVNYAAVVARSSSASIMHPEAPSDPQPARLSDV